MFAVADGVGGYAGAKEASALAIEMLEKRSSNINSEGSLRDCIKQIHSEIRKRSQKLGFENMGTTLAVAKLVPEKRSVILGNVGDSPILMLRGKSHRLEAAYHDDSYRSYDSMSMFGIVQYLGLDCNLEVHVRTIQYDPDSTNIILLCSDGVTDNLVSAGDNDLLVSLVAKGSAEKIVNRALEEGFKPDDMTAILVFL